MLLGPVATGHLGDTHTVPCDRGAEFYLSPTQAITHCQTFREVLDLLDDFRLRNKMMPNVPNMATAMHRIASTGVSEPQQVINDPHFQRLVLDVERCLQENPQMFGEQHLANVVWGAAKLRLLREPLFNLVKAEVLSGNRNLSEFTPQQLAAIAWSYAMVNFDAPQLFEAVQMEAARQPQLAEMLQKAGLLRGNDSMIGTKPAGRGAAPHMNATQWPGLPQSQRPPGPMQGNHPPFSRPPPSESNGHAFSSIASNRPPPPHNLVGPNYSSSAPSSAGFSNQQNMQSTPSLLVQPQPQQPIQSQAPFQQLAAEQHAYPSTSIGSNSRLPATDSETTDQVAAAAEKHKREMEERQRAVLGDEDGGPTCPLCCEEMESTDLALLPCPCGYQICLLCLHKIRNEGNKQCPACRSEYEEEKFRQKDPPMTKKEEPTKDDGGWETGGKKKSSNKKQPALSFPGFNPKVADMIIQCHDLGIVTRGELDDRVMEDLRALPERGAIAVLSEFMKKDMSRIRNKSAFVNGIIERVQKELTNERLLQKGDVVERPQNFGGWQHGPPGGGAYEQRSRALSDEGIRGGPPFAGPVGRGGGRGNPNWFSRQQNDMGSVINGMAGLDVVGHVPSVNQIAPEVQEKARMQVEQFLQSRNQQQQLAAHHFPPFPPPQNAPHHSAPMNYSNVAPGPLPSGFPPKNNRDVDQFPGYRSHQPRHASSEDPGALAGSRILALIQGGGENKPPQEHAGKQHPPMYMRNVNGGIGSRTHGGGILPNPVQGAESYGRKYEAYTRDAEVEGWNSNVGEYEEGSPSGEEETPTQRMDRCYQCGRDRLCEIDQTDGNFYCTDCWGAFEVEVLRETTAQQSSRSSRSGRGGSRLEMSTPT
mmetsp:Transcript_39984/g.125587  ORF Transcript_39984/g.125587 Transcript_39984/m.125587 type:complete len:872 (-) Transcript_39984:79-2694(-)